jgi:predicted Zn-dependent protease
MNRASLLNRASPPSKVRPVRPASRVIALVTATAVALGSLPARAQNGSNAGIPMIRDAEIEQLLRDYYAPIEKAAGLSNQNVKVVIINDKSFNAFVMDAHHVFVNAGALMEAETPNQLIGVFSHETGHIVGGHLAKMRQELANAQTAAIIAMLLGVGAVVAGARSNNADMAMSAALCLRDRRPISMNSLLAYQRAQEEQADRAGVRFLTMTGQSAKGMYDTFKRFADESLYSSRLANPYMQNHPMPQERMDALAELVKTSYWDKKDPPELQFRHDMMRAKMYGFMDGQMRCCGAIRCPTPACLPGMRVPSRPIVLAICTMPSPTSTA